MDRSHLIAANINRGKALYEQKRYQEAYKCFQNIEHCHGNDYNYLYFYGRLKLQNRENSDARKLFLQALKLNNSNELDLYIAIATTYYQDCDFNKAISISQLILKNKEITSELENYLQELICYCYLSMGDLTKGWQLYNYRKPGLLVKAQLAKKCNLPFWQGENKPNANLLVVAEDGLGDELIYTSFIHLLPDKVKQVYLECDARLIPLFARTYPDIIFFARNNIDSFKKAAKHCDMCVLLGDLPRYLNPEMAKGKTIALKPAHKFKKNLPNNKSLVGISYYTPVPNSEYRMPPLDFWEKIFKACPGVAFINLQENKKTDPKKRSFLYNHKSVQQINEVDLYNDLNGLAELICHMDFVLSISNYIAHFTGRLARPSALVAQKFCNCRWILAEDPSPWYPTLKLIRGKEVGGWEEVKNNVINILHEL